MDRFSHHPMIVLHRVLLVASVLMSQVHGQQPEAPTAGPRPEFRVLEQRTLPQNDGGSLTFKRVVPPAAAPIVPAPVPPAPTAAELARLQELESKTSTLLIVSASVNAQGQTMLRWHCNEEASCRHSGQSQRLLNHYEFSSSSHRHDQRRVLCASGGSRTTF